MNIDRLKDQKYTKYPFTVKSSLLLDSLYIFPVAMISSLNLQVPNVCTCYFYTIQQHGLSDIQVVIRSNKNDTYTFHVLAGHIMSFISNKYECPAGIITYRPLLYSILLAAITNAAGTITLNKTQLELLPLCITLLPVSGCQAILVDGTVIALNATLSFRDNVTCDLGLNGTNIVSVFGDVDMRDKALQGITSVCIVSGTTTKTLSALDRLLVIKPAALSDMRVITTKLSIELRGVANE